MRRLLIITAALCALVPSAAGAASPSPSPSTTPSGPMAPTVGQVLISEVMPNPVGTDTGTEWVELSNQTDRTILIGGMAIARSTGTNLLTIPSGTTLAPHAYLKLVTTGSIVNGGDTIILRLGTTEHDRITYDGSGSEGQSWSRTSATEGAWTDTPTPDAPNSIQEVVEEESAAAVSAASTKAGSASTKAKKASTAKKAPASSLPKSGPSALPYLIPPLGWALWRYGRERFHHGNQR